MKQWFPSGAETKPKTSPKIAKAEPEKDKGRVPCEDAAQVLKLGAVAFTARRL